MTTYAYDNWIQLPTRDLYDTQIMAMAINAAKDMYEKGEQRIKDFNTAYGDFITPIQADQDWYNQNVTGKVRDTINNLYARGIDPLRSAEGRAIVAQLVNNIPVGDVAKLRSSAKNAEAFLKARQELEAKGLYNPLLAKYDGPDMATYHTLEDESGAGMGIWERMSPTRITDMATFGNPYFEGMKPNIHSASKNGVSYSIEKIDENDLRAIADAHYNELVSTPQGQLMHRYYTDLAGGDPVKARQMFNDAVVDGQRRRIYQKDDYDDNYFQHENLRLKNASLALQRQNLALKQRALAAKQRGDTGGPGTQLNGISLARSWYNTAMNNAWGADGITKDITSEGWYNGNNYAQFGKESEKIFRDFGQTFKVKSEKSLNNLLQTPTGKKYKAMLEKAYSTPYDKLNRDQKFLLNSAKKEATSFVTKDSISGVQEQYRKQFSIPMDGESVTQIVSTPLSDNKTVGKIKPGFIDKLYGTDDIISNTSGYRFTHTSKSTKAIRDAINRYGASNTTIASLEEGYGSLRKNTGSFEVMPRVRVTCTDKDGNITFQQDAYVDVNLGSMNTKGGSYFGDYKTPSYSEIRSNNDYIIGNTQLKPDIIDVQYNPGKQFNMYPDVNRWTGFGVWDTDLTSKRLHAKASESLGTYLPITESEYNPFDDIIFDE